MYLVGGGVGGLGCGDGVEEREGAVEVAESAESLGLVYSEEVGVGGVGFGGGGYGIVIYFEGLVVGEEVEVGVGHIGVGVEGNELHMAEEAEEIGRVAEVFGYVGRGYGDEVGGAVQLDEVVEFAHYEVVVGAGEVLKFTEPFECFVIVAQDVFRLVWAEDSLDAEVGGIGGAALGIEQEDFGELGFEAVGAEFFGLLKGFLSLGYVTGFDECGNEVLAVEVVIGVGCGLLLLVGLDGGAVGVDGLVKVSVLLGYLALGGVGLDGAVFLGYAVNEVLGVGSAAWRKLMMKAYLVAAFM